MSKTKPRLSKVKFEEDIKPKIAPKFDPEPYLRPGVTKEEVIEIKQAFDLFDADKSGSLEPGDIRKAFEESGYKAPNRLIYQILAELDSDNSGRIDFEEFVKLGTTRMDMQNTREDIRKIFNLFDIDRGGKISFAELKKVAISLGEEMSDEELMIMFKKADSDDDGLVTPEDFYNMVIGKGYK